MFVVHPLIKRFSTLVTALNRLSHLLPERHGSNHGLVWIPETHHLSWSWVVASSDKWKLFCGKGERLLLFCLLQSSIKTSFSFFTLPEIYNLRRRTCWIVYLRSLFTYSQNLLYPSSVTLPTLDLSNPLTEPLKSEMSCLPFFYHYDSNWKWPNSTSVESLTVSLKVSGIES